MQKTNCDACSNYIYDDEEEYYYCAINLDEDEMAHFMASHTFECPYFQLDDEYKIVRHQM